MGHAVWSVTSAAHSLPRHNVNTLICGASFGRFFEVTKTGEVVWEYVNPADNSILMIWRLLLGMKSPLPTSS